MYTVIGSFVLVAFLVACADRRRRQRRVRVDTRTGERTVGFADYSGFDQDRILMNRSERW